MNKLFSTTEEYLAAVSRLGEMVYSRQPGAALREFYESIRSGEEALEVFPSFAILRGALGLEPPEAMCVALWLYCDSAPLPPLTTGELLEYCRRVGGRSPRQILGRLFVADGERAVLHPIAADFLLGREPRLPEGAEFYLPEDADTPPYARELYHELKRFLAGYMDKAEAFPLLLALNGEAGSGRKFLLSRLADGIGCPMLRVDFTKTRETSDILLAAEIYGAVICMENAADTEQIDEIISRTGIAFAVCAEEETSPESGAYAVLRREVPPLSAETRRSILGAMLADTPLSPDLDLGREIGSRRLNIGQIRTLAGCLKAESMAAGEPIDRGCFLRVMRERADRRVTGADRVESSCTLEDLVLPEEQRSQLTELCAFTGKWHTVYKSWGFGEKLKWGRGISALFYGAPGTGKTMAAAALANETGLALMRVDISRLMSKYIGETQKNIGRIFDEAAKSDCILFFDEADALFARRSDAADAQDKYANAETAYLLQRVEQHDGVCILATNLLQNFDEAFRRRIGYMLHFPMPDESLREKIWRGVFPKEAPAETLDYAILAKHLELSGASIKNCAIHAAYLAAVHNTAIEMRYILAGAKNEYAKLGKSLSPQVAQLLAI